MLALKLDILMRKKLKNEYKMSEQSQNITLMYDKLHLITEILYTLNLRTLTIEYVSLYMF